MQGEGNYLKLGVALDKNASLLEKHGAKPLFPESGEIQWRSKHV